jgi:MtN3 and saliva related transmembrane protein
MITDLVGYAAAVVGTVLMLPQVISAIKTKSMKDVSMGMLVTYIVNCTLWDLYGILLAATPMILCNSIALLIGVWQLALKKRYG